MDGELPLKLVRGPVEVARGRGNGSDTDADASRGPRRPAAAIASDGSSRERDIDTRGVARIPRGQRTGVIMKSVICSVAAVLVSFCLGACTSGGQGDAASVRQDPLCADMVLRVDPGASSP